MLRERFSQGEWDRVCLLPALLFSLVAGADGKIDSREWKKFRSDLELGHSHELVDLIYQELEGLEPDELLRRARAAAADPQHSRLTRQSLQFRLSPQEYEEFIRAMFQAGLQVARASGGFLGQGRVSGKERLALLDFAVAFEVDLDTLT